MSTPSIDDELRTAVSGAALPGRFEVIAARATRTPTGATRVRVELQREGERAPSLVLDASTDGSATNAPFVAGPWRVTYRSTPLAFAEFAAVGAAIASRLASAFPSPNWSEGAAFSDSDTRSATQSATWFVRENELLDGLEPSSAEAMRGAFEARIASRTSGALSVLLYLGGTCTQRCVFCTVPHERDAGLSERRRPPLALVASGAFDALLAALATRSGSMLTLLGDDWSAHSEIEAMLDRLARSPVRSSLLGPGTALASDTLARRVATISNLECVTVTLEASPDTERGRETHDAVVGRVGAAALVLEGIERLRELGVPAKVANVITRESIDALPELASFCVRRSLPLAISGFVPDRTRAATFRPHEHVARADRTRAALARAYETGAMAIERVVGVPTCAVPPELASKSSSAWDSADAEAWVKPEGGPCATCPAFSACPGVPVAYVRAHGFAGLAHVPSPRR